ncbi:MAG: hypothetical protein DRO73_05505 [Candidatus Thorarchaeota archaeon]|nr:MAG: hypothetical protein DRO73_05505 [Candidatus Thorarchaeota archaeon]
MATMFSNQSGSTTHGSNSSLVRVLRDLKAIHDLAMSVTTRRMSHRILADFYDSLMWSIDDMWQDAMEGRLVVDSISVLRALRDVQCRDLLRLIREPELHRDRIVRETRLMRNILVNLVRPQSHNRGRRSKTDYIGSHSLS